MRVTADTNLLVRLVTGDDPAQASAVLQLVEGADLVALPTTALCELVWVLRTAFRASPRAIAATIRGIIANPNAAWDRQAVEAGLAMLDAGGDFADGAVAFEGQRLGGTEFVSFDRAAVRRLHTLGLPARLLA